MALEILTINISDGQSGVSVSHSFSVSFNKDIDTDSVSSATVYVYDTILEEIVPSDIEVSGSTIEVTPKVLLRPERSYEFTLVGKGSSALNTVYIKADDGDYLEETQTYQFTTGTLADVTVVAFPDDIAGMPGISDNVPYDTAPGSLEIDYVSPSYTSYGLPVSLNRIVIKFSENVPEQNDLVSVSIRGLLNSDKYYVQKDGDNYVYYYEDSENYDWTVPEYSLTWENDYLYIEFTKNGEQVSASNPFFYNTSILVSLDADLTSDNGNSLGVDTEYEFILESAPAYCTVEEVKFHPAYAVLSQDVDDVFIYRLISYYSYQLRRKFNVPETGFSDAAANWVVCKVVYHMLHRLLVALNTSGPVAKKALGSLSISYGSSRQSLLPVDGPSTLRSLMECIRVNTMHIRGSVGAVGIRKIASYSWKYLAVRQPRDADYEAGMMYTNKGKFASIYSWTDWPYTVPPGYDYD